MDDIDRQLIALLRENARVPVATLAKKLRVARGTVQNRLAKLEADGTIVGYTVRLRPQVEEQRIRALMTRRRRRQQGRGGARRRCAAIRRWARSTAPTVAGTSLPSCVPTASKRSIACSGGSD